MADVPSVRLPLAPASGYTSGQALAAIAEVAKENLPAGFAYELGGMAREEAETSGSTTGLIFVLCFVFVYLLLSAQYESYILPLSVLLSVPFGLLGSFLFVSGIGSLGNIPALKMILGTMSNDIYMQTDNHCQRSHQDRTQTGGGTQHGSPCNAHTHFAAVEGELYDQDGVLGQQTHQHDKCNLHVDVVRHGSQNHFQCRNVTQ